MTAFQFRHKIKSFIKCIKNRTKNNILDSKSEAYISANNSRAIRKKKIIEEVKACPSVMSPETKRLLPPNTETVQTKPFPIRGMYGITKIKVNKRIFIRRDRAAIGPVRIAGTYFRPPPTMTNIDTLSVTTDGRSYRTTRLMSIRIGPYESEKKGIVTRTNS
ncbi:hypothetical protein GWI33_017211 [Rhynchophorus ferrugineus]|uniref:Uncharacterized protein n=1 Tax=Rhynchophorus ferrugineus TaxID=354439 RepID=A0A834I2F1_RHYFE|nr:hypothetical protein GWI33_017211 [Rhynchophorus ferrugineus]